MSITERIEAQLGSRQALIDAGRFSVHESYGGKRFTRSMMKLVAEPADIYRLVWRFSIPNNYRCIETEYKKLSKDMLQLKARIKPGYQDCESWFLTAIGALPLIPTVLDRDEAVIVKSDITPRNMEVLIKVPVSNRFFSRTRRVVEMMWSPSALIGELEFQQQQMSDSYDSMQKNEAEFRRAFEALPILVAFHRDGFVVYANPAMCRSLGYEKGGMIGVALSDMLGSAGSTQLAVADKDSLLLLTLQGRDGRDIRVEARVEEDVVQGGKSCAAIYATDVSDREQARGTVEALLRSSRDLILRIDSSGAVLDMQGGNGFVLNTSTRDRDSENVANVLARIPGVTTEVADWGWSAIRRAMLKSERISQSLVAGEERFFDCQLLPDIDGTALLTIRDVSDLRNHERDLAQADRLISLGTLVAGVGHEINNPLAYILGNAEYLEEEFAAGDSISPKDVAEALGEIVEGAERISKIVSSLRGFSRVEHTKIEPVDVEAVIERAVRIASPQLGPGVSLVREYQGPPPALADTSQLEQVVLNLLVNAVQAKQEAQTLTITLSTQIEGANTLIVVTDNGSGISPTELVRVFDAFYTTKKVGEGTGLGLSIAHRIIESAGGVLSVTSELGRGSSFVVSLPSACVR
ncbi:MAG: PAS domain S-box protein [Kofleriaceae bacterium]|nr:PAS domain S-box protein [Kofleriaceae bacterium]